MIATGWSEAKAIENNFFVGQERKPGDRNRLETDVVLVVNDAFQRMFLEGSQPFVMVINLRVGGYKSWITDS